MSKGKIFFNLLIKPLRVVLTLLCLTLSPLHAVSSGLAPDAPVKC